MLLSPCLHPLPTQLHDRGTRIRNRHADFLVNQRSSDLIRLRSEIVRYLRRYLLDDCQVEVQTPILAAGAGGAIARPFKTSATEFPGRQLVLRVAPELWLKRMVVGGYDRVFEIGPSFRNEGLSVAIELPCSGLTDSGRARPYPQSRIHDVRILPGLY